MSIQFCCQGFKGLLNRAGQRGPSVIVVEKSSDQLKFRLQSRGIAYEDLEGFKKIIIPIEVNIWTTETIAYCPYCGSCLQELFEAAPKEYTDLAAKHAHLRTGLDVPAESA
jgi:hypothetical protein